MQGFFPRSRLFVYIDVRLELLRAKDVCDPRHARGWRLSSPIDSVHHWTQFKAEMSLRGFGKVPLNIMKFALDVCMEGGPQNYQIETKRRFCKRAVLANVPSFLFLGSRGTSECTFVPVFGTGEHPNVFGTREHPPM